MPPFVVLITHIQLHALFTMQFLVLALAAVAAAQSTIYDVETVTDNLTTDVTITSCPNNACATTVEATSQTVVTTTVDGVETVYTTICPETEAGEKAAAASEAPAPAAPSASASGSDQYVDVTVTPTVTASTGVEATSTLQATITSYYNSLAANSYTMQAASEGAAAGQHVAYGVAGVAGLAVLLL